MAVKHLNFAGKTAVGQRQRPTAKKVRGDLKPLAAAPKKLKKATLQPVQKTALKNAISGVAKGSARAAGEATRKASLMAGLNGALAAGAKATAKASGRVAGEVYKSGGGYKSSPTYGKGLGVTQAATKKTRKVKGH